MPIVSFAADVYSVGLVLFELCTGRSLLDEMVATENWSSLLYAFEWMRTGVKPPPSPLEERGLKIQSSFGATVGQVLRGKATGDVALGRGVEDEERSGDAISVTRWGDVPTFGSAHAQDRFLDQLLTTMATSRRSLMRVSPSFWTEKMKPLLIQCLRWGPHTRPSASALLGWMRIELRKGRSSALSPATGDPLTQTLLRFHPLPSAWSTRSGEWNAFERSVLIPLQVLPHAQQRRELVLLAFLTLTSATSWKGQSCRVFFLVVTWIDRTLGPLQIAQQPVSQRHIYVLALLWLADMVLREPRGGVTTAPSSFNEREMGHGDWTGGMIIDNVQTVQQAIFAMYLRIIVCLDGQWIPDGTPIWHAAQSPLHLLEVWWAIWDVELFWARLRANQLTTSSPNKSLQDLYQSSSLFRRILRPRDASTVVRRPDPAGLASTFFSQSLTEIVFQQREWECRLPKVPLEGQEVGDVKIDAEWQSYTHLPPSWKAWLASATPFFTVSSKTPASKAQGYHQPALEDVRRQRETYFAIPRDTAVIQSGATVKERLGHWLVQAEDQRRGPDPSFESVEFACSPGDMKQNIGTTGAGGRVPASTSTSTTTASTCLLYPRRRYQDVLLALLMTYQVASFINRSTALVVLERQIRRPKVAMRTVESVQVALDLRVEGKPTSPHPLSLSSPITAELDYFFSQLFNPASPNDPFPPFPHMELKIQVTVRFQKQAPPNSLLQGWHVLRGSDEFSPYAGWISLQWRPVNLNDLSTWSLVYWMSSGEDVARTPWSKRLPTKHMKVVEEIMSSEQSYVYSLYTALDLYFRPLSTGVLPPDIAKSASNQHQLKEWLEFGEVLKEVVEFNHEFLDVLTASTSLHEIGDIMRRFFGLHLLRLYTHYVGLYTGPMAHLMKQWALPSAPKTFRSLLDPHPPAQSLASYLIMPVQRILRYVLLLTELVKSLGDYYRKEANVPEDGSVATWTDGLVALEELDDILKMLIHLAASFDKQKEVTSHISRVAANVGGL